MDPTQKKSVIKVDCGYEVKQEFCEELQEREIVDLQTVSAKVVMEEELYSSENISAIRMK